MADITYNVYIDWDNNGSVASGAFTSGETVSSRVLNVRTNQQWSFGRDSARSLAAVKPAEVTLELNNVSRDYSPDNASSPLFGNVGPGKPVLIRATHSAVNYDLFWGFIDDFTIDPFREHKSVTLTCIDALGKLAQAQVTTDAYQSIQTGTAVGKVLDAAGWSASKRDLDYGSSTLRYWCADQTGAWEAIQELVTAEGPPAIAYVDSSGNFVFRDRQHRRMRAASATSQATFRDTGSEPLFSDPVEFNIGFRDLINSVDYNIEEREPGELRTIWSTEDTITVPASTTLVIAAHIEDPCTEVIAPVQDKDYTILAGSGTVTVDRTAGQTFDISLAAGVSGLTIEKLALRGYFCLVRRELVISSVDSASVTKHGIAHPEADFQPKWLSKNDAQAIADRITAQYGDRLPVMTITVKNANDTRKVQMLSRKISDMVTIVEAETSTNHTHYIEFIGHNISEAGKAHSTQFGCERSGVDSPTNIFILDSAVSGNRLGTGKLAN